MYAHEYIKKTYNSKAKYLGQGCFSEVYQHPTNPDRVLKFVKGDKAYINYARFAMKNPQNPYLPKVFSIKKPDFFSSFDYIVELEKLKACTAKKDRQVTWKLQKFGGFDLQEKPYRSISWISTSSWKKLAKLSPCSDFKQAMNYIMNRAGHLGVADDIHRGNIMFRQNQLVFTDPLVD